jgi:hypothetical protein
MTTEHTSTDGAARPLGVGLSEGLGVWLRTEESLKCNVTCAAGW